MLVSTSRTLVRLWDVVTGVNRWTLNGFNDKDKAVASVAFSPNSKTLASVLGDKTIQLWGTAKSVLQRTLDGHDMRVYNIAFSSDGKLLVSSTR